jgi:altronate hydrolase
MDRALKLHPGDNALVALQDLRRGETVTADGHEDLLLTDVPAKHKFLTEDLPAGAKVIMYGVIVGKTREALRRGEAINTRNLGHATAGFDDDAGQNNSGKHHWISPNVDRWRQRTFAGYRRPDGQVGTRNYWVIVPLVFCENRNIGVLKQAFEEELGFSSPTIYHQQVAALADLYKSGKAEEISQSRFDESPNPAGRARLFHHVDGIKFLLHEGGCGGTREDANNLCGLIAGYIHHPNVAGATVLSLGCQHAQVPILQHQLRARDPNFAKPLFIFEQQQSGSEFKMLSEAIRSTFLGLMEADKTQREPVPLSHLRLGLKCGGSDGFSGISANPSIGHTADLLAALGGGTILSEFPELCGVEQELIQRCTKKETGDRFIRLMRSYAERAKAAGSGFDMNPSPGNIRDGLITDAMKSAGAARKGGTSPVTAVLDYPEYATEPGLNLQCTPGNDVECVTAQVGAGANVVLFTTGLGTPTGNPIAPVMKISTNSALAERMFDIIDVDTGGIIQGEKSVEQMGEHILEQVIRVASGEIQTKAELLGQDDFIPWKRGVSL